MKRLAVVLAACVLAFSIWFVFSKLAPPEPFHLPPANPPALQAHPVPTTCPARAAYQLPNGAWACTPGPYGNGNEQGVPVPGSEAGP